MKAAAPPLDTIADHAAAISRLLIAIENSPSPAATIAFRSAIARHGRELNEVGGIKAMRAALDQAADSGPDQNDRRAIVLDAWARVPGWHIGAGADAA